MCSPRLARVETRAFSSVACAAAIEAIKIISHPFFLQHARAIGEVLKEELFYIEGKLMPYMRTNVRGLGPMQLIELSDKENVPLPGSIASITGLAMCVAFGVIR